MSKIELKYAWSNSRVKILRECMWKYYLMYFYAWEGWLKTASPEKRQAYILKNMTNLLMWIGSVVHDEIELIIKHIKDEIDVYDIKNGGSGNIISQDEALNNVVQALRRGWMQSKQKRWEDNPKQNINLAEHYYQQNISEKQLNALKIKTLLCIKSFYDSPIYNIMLKLQPTDWLTIEDFQEFTLNTKEKVSVKIDCGFKHDGKIYLIDWKTGKIDQSVKEQLTTYAMYALKQGWTRKLEDIIIMPVFLAAYQDQKELAMPKLTISMDDISRQANIIRDEYPILTEAYDNRNNPDFFKHTNNEDNCKWCHFRGMCSGATKEKTPFD